MCNVDGLMGSRSETGCPSMHLSPRRSDPPQLVQNYQRKCAGALITINHPWRERMNNLSPTRFPMLESILNVQNMPLQPIYSKQDVVKMFSVCDCSTQWWVFRALFNPRSLASHLRFLPQDLEDSLQTIQKRGCKLLFSTGAVSSHLHFQGV
jgi:hypothetical protein